MAEDIVVEQWCPVDGYEGLYDVSNLGRVFSHKSKRHVGTQVVRYGKPWYLVVSLNGVGKPRLAFVHRLVAAAFIGPCPIGCEVNHIDGDKGNARADNLEYVTHSANLKHAVNRLGFKPWFTLPENIGRGGGKGVSRCRGENNPHAVFDDAMIRDIRSRYAAGEKQRCIAASLGVHQATISKIVNGVAWKHVGASG